MQELLQGEKAPVRKGRKRRRERQKSRTELNRRRYRRRTCSERGRRWFQDGRRKTLLDPPGVRPVRKTSVASVCVEAGGGTAPVLLRRWAVGESEEDGGRRRRCSMSARGDGATIMMRAMGQSLMFQWCSGRRGGAGLLHLRMDTVGPAARQASIQGRCRKRQSKR